MSFYINCIFEGGRAEPSDSARRRLLASALRVGVPLPSDERHVALSASGTRRRSLPPKEKWNEHGREHGAPMLRKLRVKTTERSAVVVAYNVGTHHQLPRGLSARPRASTCPCTAPRTQSSRRARRHRPRPRRRPQRSSSCRPACHPWHPPPRPWPAPSRTAARPARV